MLLTIGAHAGAGTGAATLTVARLAIASRAAGDGAGPQRPNGAPLLAQDPDPQKAPPLMATTDGTHVLLPHLSRATDVANVR